MTPKLYSELLNKDNLVEDLIGLSSLFCIGRKWVDIQNELSSVLLMDIRIVGVKLSLFSKPTYLCADVSVRKQDLRGMEFVFTIFNV